MRKRLFEIIEPSADEDKASTTYDVAMMAVILASLVPLAFKKNDTPALAVIDKATTNHGRKRKAQIIL